MYSLHFVQISSVFFLSISFLALVLEKNHLEKTNGKLKKDVHNLYLEWERERKIKKINKERISSNYVLLLLFLFISFLSVYIFFWEMYFCVVIQKKTNTFTCSYGWMLCVSLCVCEFVLSRPNAFYFIFFSYTHSVFWLFVCCSIFLFLSCILWCFLKHWLCLCLSFLFFCHFSLCSSSSCCDEKYINTECVKMNSFSLKTKKIYFENRTSF